MEAQHLAICSGGGGSRKFLSRMTRRKNTNSGLVEWDFMGATVRSRESDYNGRWTTDCGA